jgi:hypothetical protein
MSLLRVFEASIVKESCVRPLLKSSRPNIDDLSSINSSKSVHIPLFESRMHDTSPQKPKRF